MEGLIILLVLLAIACVVCGPAALIISIIALSKMSRVEREQARRVRELVKPAVIPEKPPEVREAERPAAAREEPVEPSREKPPAEAVGVARVKDESKARLEAFKMAAERVKESQEGFRRLKAVSFEQQIGTRWVLIAGIITVIFAAGFFLKYAYDREWIGPTGRVIIVAVVGLVALAAGEITRRRGYGIVAKGVAALGFALLYTAVFSAYRWYSLIGLTPAFALAILVTAAAMLYAVSLNEIVVAFLSLLGGFLTPLIVSTGENRPMELFSYTLILGVGAMLCSYYRKWRAINLLAFVGTFVLYVGWFEKFYRPEIAKAAEGAPEQMGIALGWLWVFFGIYLVLPMLYELVKRVKAREEDVLCVLVNSAVVFFYLWTILFDDYRTALAFCAIGLCAAHLVMMGVVIRRCKDDVSLRLALLVIGLIFLTIAVPLYLKMYAVAMAWAVEGVILVVIGLRYRSNWTQIGGGAALLLSIGKLLHQLPMHEKAFQLVFNPAFGTWCFVTAAIVVCHIIYRRNSELKEDLRRSISQILYAAAVLLMMAGVIIEWWCHCDINVVERAAGERLFVKGVVLILTVFPLLFLIRPVCPKGILRKILAAILAGAGSVFTMVAFTEFYNSRFVIFANLNFGIVLVFVAGLFAGAWMLKQLGTEEERDIVLPAVFAIAGIFVLWVLLTEEIYLYWYCRDRFGEGLADWRFWSHMCISVMWAVYGAALMVAGFWRNIKLLRYIALGLFVLLLVKVFILDTSTVKNVYRIAAFFATGVTLVGVSYLYQYLKKKGFFEAMLAEKGLDE